MTIGVLIEALLGGPSNTTTPTSESTTTNDKKGGAREWIKSKLKALSQLACSLLGVGNQQELSTDLECDPFLNTAMQRFTCDLYCWFGALLAPVSVGIITGKHCAKNSITKLNDGTCDTSTRNCNQTEEPSEY